MNFFFLYTFCFPRTSGLLHSWVLQVFTSRISRNFSATAPLTFRFVLPSPLVSFFCPRFFSFAGHLLMFTRPHFGGSLVEILSKKSLSQWHERITGMRFSLCPRYWECLSKMEHWWRQRLYKGRDSHGRCVKLRCIFMQVTLIAGIFCTDPTYHLKNLNWYVLLMGTELFWWIFLG